MPTYEYRCKSCEQEVEVVQSFTDDALTTCEACGGPLRKLFGSVGIAFKGSGFYKNDSRGKVGGAKDAGDKADKSTADTPSTDAGSGDKAAPKGTGDKAAPATKDKGPSPKTDTKAPAKKDAAASGSTRS